MSQDGPEGRLYELLMRIGRLLQSEERAAEAGLLPVQLHALHYLSRANRYSNTPLAVAEFLGVTKGTASQTLRALERNGLVRRSVDAADRRVQRLEPTTEGRRTLRRVLPPRVVDQAAERLGGRADRLVEDLTELLRQMQLAQGSRTFGVCHTCRHFEKAKTGGVCGLTGERLRSAEISLICRENDPLTESAPEPLPRPSHSTQDS